MTTTGRIDARGNRFSQGLTGLLALTAYLLDRPILVALLAVVLAAGAFLGPRHHPWGIVFARVVRPALRLSPPSKLKDAAPVRFANLVGFLFLAGGSVLLLLPVAWAFAAALAWILVLAVAALALLAAATDVCVGCVIYVWVGRAFARRTSGA